MSFLKINNLSVDYEMRRETVYAAKNVNIEVNKGEILGLVGESGSGKSTVGNAIINLIDEPGRVSNGSIVLDGIDIHADPKNIEPLETLPGSSIRFIIALPTVLFPEPDSPTSPKISPLLTSMVTFFAA